MKQLLLVLLCTVALGCNRGGTQPKPQVEATPQAERKTFLLFVKIPDPVMPIERGTKYEDPLDAFLKAKGLGEVSGGGSQLSQTNAAGQRSIEWVGVDVDVFDPDTALPIVVAKLKEMGVPEGTEIEQYKPAKRTIKVR